MAIDREFLEKSFPSTFEYFEHIGLSKEDFLAYVTLVTEGPMKASDLGTLLDVDRNKIYRILKTLESKGAVEIVGGRPMVYGATPIDQLLARVVTSKEQELQQLRKNIGRAVETFYSNIAQVNAIQQKDIGFRFRFIEGYNNLVADVMRVVDNTKEDLRAVVDKYTFYKFHRSEILPRIASCIERGVNVRIGIEYDPSIEAIVDAYKGGPFTKYYNSGYYPVYLISDKKELVILLETGNKNDASESMKSLLGFWCNSTPFATRMTSMFDYLWDNAISPNK